MSNGLTIRGQFTQFGLKTHFGSCAIYIHGEWEVATPRISHIANLLITFRQGPAKPHHITQNYCNS